VTLQENWAAKRINGTVGRVLGLFKAHRDFVVVWVVAAAFFASQVLFPQTLSNYDSGVYSAAAIHLVHGVIPYRDFVFVQPPGVLYVLAPAALVGIHWGTAATFTLFRLEMCLFSAFNVSIVYLLIRPASRRLAWVAALIMTLAPVMLFVESAVKLEPPLLTVVLLATWCLRNLEDKRLTNQRALRVIGIFYGCGLAVKYWAIVPLFATLIMLVPRYHWRVLELIKSASLTFLLLISPFLLFDGANFLHETVWSQLQRTGSTGWQVSIWDRLEYLLGNANPPYEPHTRVVALLVFEIVMILILANVLRRHNSEFLRLCTALALVTTGFALALPEWFPYYASFALPFALVAACLSVDSIAQVLKRHRNRLPRLLTAAHLPRWPSIVAVLSLTAALSILWWQSHQDTVGSFTSQNLPLIVDIPSRSCTVFDVEYDAVLANRVDEPARCPVVVDPSGMALSAGTFGATPTPTLILQWRSIFSRADYVVLQNPQSSFVPWSPSLRAYFNRSFVLQSPNSLPLVYRRRS
jgi:hypothetical protein